MAEIDLDQARAARAEARKEPHTLRFKGEVFTLAPELPLEFSVAFREHNIEGIVRVLLDGQFERFLELGPTFPDIETIAERLPEIYGITVGESSASGAPSKSTGDRSRRTSRASTRGSRR